MIKNIFEKSLFALILCINTNHGFAEDLSSCTLKKTPDEINFCKASFAGSGTFCDLISNGEKKRECYFAVVKIQRSNAYQIKKYEAQKPDKD